MSQPLSATQSPASTAVSKPAALPVKKAEFQMSSSDQLASKINKMGRYLIIGQIVGVLRVVYGIAKAAICLIASLFAGYVLCKPKTAAQISVQYQDGVNHVKRGVAEFFCRSKGYDKQEKKALIEKKADFNAETFKTEGFKKLPQASDSQNLVTRKKDFDKVMAEFQATGKTSLSALDKKALAPQKAKLEKQINDIKISERLTADEKAEKIAPLQKGLQLIAAKEKEYFQSASSRAAFVKQYKHIQGIHNGLMQELQTAVQEKAQKDQNVRKQIAVLLSGSPLLESDKAAIIARLNDIIADMDKEKNRNLSAIEHLNTLLSDKFQASQQEALAKAKTPAQGEIATKLSQLTKKDNAAKRESLERANLNLSQAQDEIVKKIALVKSGTLSVQERQQVAKMLSYVLSQPIHAPANVAAAKAQTKASVQSFKTHNLATQDRYDAVCAEYHALKEARDLAGLRSSPLAALLPPKAISTLTDKDFQEIIREVIANMPKHQLRALLIETNDDAISSKMSRHDSSLPVSVGMMKAFHDELIAMQKKLGAIKEETIFSTLTDEEIQGYADQILASFDHNDFICLLKDAKSEDIENHARLIAPASEAMQKSLIDKLRDKKNQRPDLFKEEPVDEKSSISLFPGLLDSQPKKGSDSPKYQAVIKDAARLLREAVLTNSSRKAEKNLIARLENSFARAAFFKLSAKLSSKESQEMYLELTRQLSAEWSKLNNGAKKRDVLIRERRLDGYAPYLPNALDTEARERYRSAVRDAIAKKPQNNNEELSEDGFSKYQHAVHKITKDKYAEHLSKLAELKASRYEEDRLNTEFEGEQEQEDEITADQIAKLMPEAAAQNAEFDKARSAQVEEAYKLNEAFDKETAQGKAPDLSFVKFSKLPQQNYFDALRRDSEISERALESADDELYDTEPNFSSFPFFEAAQSRKEQNAKKA